jgi:hypothetical protein
LHHLGCTLPFVAHQINLDDVLGTSTVLDYDRWPAAILCSQLESHFVRQLLSGGDGEFFFASDTIPVEVSFAPCKILHLCRPPPPPSPLWQDVELLCRSFALAVEQAAAEQNGVVDCLYHIAFAKAFVHAFAPLAVQREHQQQAKERTVINALRDTLHYTPGQPDTALRVALNHYALKVLRRERSIEQLLAEDCAEGDLGNALPSLRVMAQTFTLMSTTSKLGFEPFAKCVPPTLRASTPHLNATTSLLSPPAPSTPWHTKTRISPEQVRAGARSQAGAHSRRGCQAGAAATRCALCCRRDALSATHHAGGRRCSGSGGRRSASE